MRNGWKESLSETDPPQQVSKPRIRVKAVKHRLYLDGSGNFALLVRLFQPLERVIFLPQPCIDERKVVRGDIALLGPFFQFAKHPLRLTSFSRDPKGVAKRGDCPRIAWR